MKIIKYFNKELTDYNVKKETVKINNEDTIEIEKKEPVYEIKPLKYETSDKEFDKWLNIIKKTYGKYGEVTFEEKEDEAPIQEKLNSQLLKSNAALQVDIAGQKKLNSQLLKDNADLQLATNNQQILSSQLLLKLAELNRGE